LHNNTVDVASEGLTHDEKYKDEFKAIADHSNEKIHAGKLSFCSPSAFSQDDLIYLSKVP